MQTFGVIGYHNHHRIKIFCVIRYCMDHRIQISVLVDIRQITGQITGQIIGYSRQTLLSGTVARSDWFHYCIIVCTVESIQVDCNLYF